MLDIDYSTKAVTSDALDEYGRSLTARHHDDRKPGQKCFHVLKILFIQVGLLVILGGYLIGGGYLFRALELDNEASECFQKQNGYYSKLNASALRAIGVVESVTDVARRELLVKNIMREFAEQLFILDFQPSTNCKAILETEYGADWNLGNSIFFCATVITTIGYGHISPATFWGRFSCIIYAVIGIPLMLVYLAVIGNVLAKLFRLVYINIICCRCFYDIFHRRRQRERELLKKWEQELKEHEEEEARRRGLPVPPRKVQRTNTEDSEDSDDEVTGIAANTDGKMVAVPLTVSIVILTGYTVLGAVIFQLWETWSLMDAAYFSLTTIATIGFGDLVPGAGRLHEPDTAAELGLGALYIILGLALLSMCVNLIQDEMVAKFRYMLQCFTGCRSSSSQQAIEHTVNIVSDPMETKPFPSEMSYLEDGMATENVYEKEADPSGYPKFERSMEFQFQNTAFQPDDYEGTNE